MCELVKVGAVSDRDVAVGVMGEDEIVFRFCGEDIVDGVGGF